MVRRIRPALWWAGLAFTMFMGIWWALASPVGDSLSRAFLAERACGHSADRANCLRDWRGEAEARALSTVEHDLRSGQLPQTRHAQANRQAHARSGQPAATLAGRPESVATILKPERRRRLCDAAQSRRLVPAKIGALHQTWRQGLISHSTKPGATRSVCRARSGRPPPAMSAENQGSSEGEP